MTVLRRAWRILCRRCPDCSHSPHAGEACVFWFGGEWGDPCGCGLTDVVA